MFQPCSTLFQPFWATGDQYELKTAILDHLDSNLGPYAIIWGPNLGIYSAVKVSQWSILMAHTMFQPCSTLFQPFWATGDQYNLKPAILDHLDPIWDLIGTKFGHL